MKLLFLGAGAVGGYFGARLSQAGADVTFLVRPARHDRLQADGLRVATPDGGFTVRPRVVTAETVDRLDPVDAVVLAPKAWDLADAADAVARVPGEPLVLPLLNGLDHLDLLDRRFGRARVPGGVAHIAATLDPDGTVRQLGPLHSLTAGARHPDHADRVRDLVARCAGAGFDARYADDIDTVLWSKWTFLATLAGVTTACRASVGEITATAAGGRLVRTLYDDACRVAAASGRPVPEAERERALGLLLQPGSPFTASMLRDLRAGLRTEHEHVLGGLVARADALGLPIEALRLSLTALQVRAAAATPA